MSRRTRDLPDCFPQHIWARGNNRRRLFSYPRDYEQFLRILHNAARQRQIAIWALALLANHYHLIVSPQVGLEIPKFLKHVNQRWAQLRNQQCKGSGKLFEQSYGNRLITTPGELVIATLYVESNPVLAGITKHPSVYRYSSYNIHAGGRIHSKVVKAVVTPSPWVEGLATRRRERKPAYRKLMNEYLERKWFLAYSDRASSETSDRVTPRRPDRSRAS